MAETAKKISMIPAKVQYDRNVKLSEKKMKVAAYCRVSTELEEQDSSYEAQVEYYTSKISENENWKNAGIYADDGKSGTNTKKRADFNAMIQDALAGKIDMILTKSVSRFARNTVDSLVTIRKERGGGVRERGDQYTGGNRRNPYHHLEQSGTGGEPQHQREHPLGSREEI